MDEEGAKITSLAELTEVADDDLLVVVDKSDTTYSASGTDKKVKKSNLIKDTVPAGVVDMFAGSTAPSGYLLCDGSAVNRTTYAKLFTAIGTTYGAGDGSTTFNVPNLKGKVAVGLNSADTSFDALGETGGAKTHTLTIAEMPSHTHAYTLPNNSDPNFMTGGGSYNVKVADGTGTTTTETGGGGAHNNLQPYIVLNYIIKT
jgi:microcystin-dependent protein